jgi:hypothetical protein
MRQKTKNYATLKHAYVPMRQKRTILFVAHFQTMCGIHTGFASQ